MLSGLLSSLGKIATAIFVNRDETAAQTILDSPEIKQLINMTKSEIIALKKEFVYIFRDFTDIH